MSSPKRWDYPGAIYQFASLTAPRVRMAPSISDPDIISYWKFDEGSGTTSVDQVGGRTLTVSTATWNAGGAFGYTSDNGITFVAASSQYVTVSHDAGLSPGNITIYTWIKTSDNGALRGIVDKGWGGAGGYILQLRNGIPSFEIQNSGGGFHVCTGATDISDNAWHMVAGTYDLATQNLKVYVDGVLEATIGSATLGTNTMDIKFGGDGASTNHLNGTIDNVIIYDTAKKASTILTDYQNSI